MFSSWALHTICGRCITANSRAIEVSPREDPGLLEKGGAGDTGTCTGSCMKRGVRTSEFSKGGIADIATACGAIRAARPVMFGAEQGASLGHQARHERQRLDASSTPFSTKAR